jgi:hypothetical protein
MAKRKRNNLKSAAEGEYLINQFFFKVYASEKRPPVIDQKDLQRKYLDVMLHEYTHYLHEVSTQIGTICLLYAVGFRSLLGKYVSPDLTVSDFSTTWSEKDQKRILLINVSLDVIMGDASYEMDNIRSIENYSLIGAILHVPFEDRFIQNPIEVPVIMVQNGPNLEEIRFGKFFIYEGLAYELELVHAEKNGIQHPDDLNGTEYTILRYFGEHLMPGISRYALLTLASCSLAYSNCGFMFMTLVTAMALDLENGSDEAWFLENIKRKVREDYRQQESELSGVLDEVNQVYECRSALASTFQDLRASYFSAVRQRVINPSFEVDSFYSNRVNELFTAVPPCDYMVVFTDEDSYMRDFVGTTRSQLPNGVEIAKDYQSFACHIHYTNILFDKTINILNDTEDDPEMNCCPYFSGCDLKFRKEQPSICRHTPWKTFELAVNSDNLHCPYGQGVLLTKGIDRVPVGKI